MGKPSTFDDIEIITEDDLDAFLKGKGGGKPKKKKNKWKIWQKVLLGIFTGLFVVAAGGAGTFFVLQGRGEKSLKTQVEASAGTTDAARPEGHYILYNGKEYRYREDVVNILCLGIDKSIGLDEVAETGGLGVADAIVLVSIDTEADTLKMIAVPRDTMADVQVLDEEGTVTGEAEMQVGLQYYYGKDAAQGGELMAEAVSGLLYNVPIQRYCAINFQAIPVLNDAIGGVSVTVIEDMTWYRPEFVYGSQLYLTGDLAFDYVQQRAKWVDGSNMMRVDRQKQYILAYLEKAKSVVSQDLTIPLTIFGQLQSHMSTDLAPEDITYLVPELLNMEVREDGMQTVPGQVHIGEVYEEYYVDEEALKELVISSFYEEVPASQEE